MEEERARLRKEGDKIESQLIDLEMAIIRYDRSRGSFFARMGTSPQQHDINLEKRRLLRNRLRTIDRRIAVLTRRIEEAHRADTEEDTEEDTDEEGEQKGNGLHGLHGRPHLHYYLFKNQIGGMDRKENDNAERRYLIDRLRVRAGQVFFRDRFTDANVLTDINEIRIIARQIHDLGATGLAQMILQAIPEIDINRNRTTPREEMYGRHPEEFKTPPQSPRNN